MNTRRFTKALLFVSFAAAAAALTHTQTTAQESGSYSPFAGTWRLSGVREQITIVPNGTTVTGSIDVPNGAKTAITSGAISYEAITFTVESPDGQRTITFQGTLKGERLTLKRSVSVRAGGARGENGIFGAQGPSELTGTLVETRGSISGRILDKISGKPLAKAAVAVSRLNTGRVVNPITETDADGRFAFRNLPAGDYFLGAKMAHYMPFRFGEFDSQGMPHGIGLNPGKHFESDFQIMRTSVISGTILDEKGLPVANTGVTAFVRVNSNGSDRLEIALSGAEEIRGAYSFEEMRQIERHATTDNLGRYRLEDLAPGEYYILSRKPFVVENEMKARMSAAAAGNLAAAIGMARCGAPASAGFAPTPGANPAGPVAQGPSAEADVPMYYPGVTDATRITPVRVLPGIDVPGIDFTLRPARLGLARVSVVRQGDQTPQDGATVAVVGAGLRFGSQQPPVLCGATREGKAEIGGVVPGVQKVIAVSRQENRNWVAIEDVTIPEGGAESVTLTLRPPVDIQGQLRSDGTPAFDPSTLTVRLTPVNASYLSRVGLFLNNSAKVNADGSFVLRDVIPGLTYRLGYSGFRDSNISLLTALYGGVAVTETFTVQNGDAKLDLLIRSQRDVK